MKVVLPWTYLRNHRMADAYPILVGLDQNYVIRLAEAAIAKHNGAPVAAPWGDLVDVLHERVQVDEDLACPVSPFTNVESRRGRGVTARNASAAVEFSGGYEFRHWAESMRFQCSSRARAISGRSPASYRPPSPPRDPYLFLEQGGRVVANGLDNLCFRIWWAAENDSNVYPPSQEIQQRHLALGRALEADARTISTTPRPVEFVHAYLRDAVEFGIVYRAWVGEDSDEANERLIPTYWAMYPGVRYEPLGSEFPMGLPWSHPDPARIDNEFIGMARTALPELPTPQVWDTLMTVFARDRLRTGGEGTGNDVYDLLRAAIAIPVVRLYATDGGMKGLLDRSGVASDFGVEVYSERRQEPSRFVDDLRAFPPD